MIMPTQQKEPQKILCPICKNPLNKIPAICSKCGYIFRFFATELSEEQQKILRDEIELLRKQWLEKQNIIDDTVFNNDELTPQKAIIKRAEMDANVIILAGFAESGKSSIIEILFESFEKGSFSGYQLMNTITRNGLKERCQLRKKHPKYRSLTPVRHKRKNEAFLYSRTYLHMEIQPVESSYSRNLLFFDINGMSFFQGLISEEEKPEELTTSILEPDHFVLLIDGKIITQHSVKYAFNENIELLEKCIQSGIVNNKLYLHFAISKWDLIKNQEPSVFERIIKEIDNEKLKIKNRYRDYKHLYFENIAVRPDTPVVDMAYGLNKLLPLWINHRNVDFHKKKNKMMSPFNLAKNLQKIVNGYLKDENCMFLIRPNRSK